MGSYEEETNMANRPIRFTSAAQACIDETGVDPMDDVDRLRNGVVTATALLAECLDGADDDRHAGWHEYIDTIVSYCVRPPQW